MKDLHSLIHVARAISPCNGGNDVPLVSQIIDRQGYESLEFVIATGSLADAGATFTVLVEDGDNSALADNAAVADAQLLGTEAEASFTQADDDKVYKIGYRGSKRYVRLTITPAGNGADDYISAVAILGNASQNPTS